MADEIKVPLSGDDKEAMPVPTFKGHNFEYQEIAFRDNLTLGLSVLYGANPHANQVVMMLRFVAIAPSGYADVAKFKHFTSRGLSQYTLADGSTISGHKLNRLMIPLFVGACPHSLRVLGDYFDLWKVVAGWISEQISAEGFVLSVFDLPKLIRETTLDIINDDSIKLALEFPDFNAPEQL